MTGRLTGKVVAVTGASKGLGRVVAATLAREGAGIALLARPSTDLDSIASEIGGNALPLDCDVSNANSVRSAFRRIEARWNGLDVLINNAAVSYLNRLDSASDEDIEREIGTNLLGPIFAIREAISLMRGRNGMIVNVSSLGARQPFPYTTIYSTTKAALEMLSFALQSELRRDGIRVTTLRLGAIKTGRGLTRNWPAEKKEEYLKAVRNSGKMDLVGGWMPPQAVADSLLSILEMDPEICPALVELAGR